ncbi:MAG: right-handed parallel beta-helix repeat-containing protein [Geobacter sp.]|nr:MAG: right-handed parallel beta-helix repeat-containing protein [Geobacter sp.]
MRTWTKILLVAAMGLSAGCGDSTLSESQPTQTAVQKEAQTTTVYRVDLNARPGGDGKSWATAFDSLQAAFPQNLPPWSEEYEVWIRHGTYHLPAELHVTGSPRIYGGFDGKEVELSQRDWKKHKAVIDGDNLFRGIVKEQSFTRLVVDGVEITRCLGGAIVETSISGRLNVSNCKLTDNRGGAVSIHEGFFLIKNCEFTGNVSSNDGSAISGGDTNGSIEGCSFTRNMSAGSGGAINCFYLGRILNCAFIGNSAGLNGGAIWMHRGGAVFINCLFIENEAQLGGAVYCPEKFPSGVFTNCTLIHNQARVGGGAIHCNSPVDESGVRVRIENSIIWGNVPDQIGALRSDSVEVTYSDIMGGFAGAGNISADPMFKGGKFLLRQYSPCINAGTLNATALPATDFEGNPRVVDGIPDMGYVEAD